MEIYRIENLDFAYPQTELNALEKINLSFNKGEFVTLCGKSGCGKTTLLRLLKPSIAPHGTRSGKILFCGDNIDELDQREQAEKIGFVMQSPENQIVTDKVWHELSFGLESIGVKTPEIRTRVSEMASFFGIHNWFYRKTDELSGGQKQILNLASVMVMQPTVLVLDEPTAMLDPISAAEFLATLKKINTELGTTVILAEHRLEDAIAISDRIIVMEKGGIIADSTPKEIGRVLKEKKNDMYDALPTPMRVFESVEDSGECPVTVREGKAWLADFVKKHGTKEVVSESRTHSETPVIEAKEVFFRYERNTPDVVKNLNLTLYKGEFLAILGGNGAGKTTAISLISGINPFYRGEVLINGKKLSDIKNPYDKLLGVLPQEPKSLFGKKTAFDELMAMTDKKMPKAEREKAVFEAAGICRIEGVLKNHPYDLSGGEQERLALAMILIKKPQILIMDEPTKGMDAHFKKIFAQILEDLKRGGASILMVSHDLEFCAEFADRCALFFDGAITAEGDAREFFTKNCFYTTSANRMARDILPECVLARDIIAAIGGKIDEKKETEHIGYLIDFPQEKPPQKKKKSAIKGIFSILCFAALYAVRLFRNLPTKNAEYLVGGIAVVFLWHGLGFILPQKELGSKTFVPSKLRKRTLLAALFVALIIPLTIFFGVYYLGDRKYYFISLLIVFETLVPFLAMFEKRKAEAREIAVISVLCALGVAGRIAFFYVPEFKPLLAIVILSGVCLGGEVGFLTGAMTAFVSNFFFGQGTWTQWQMFALGLIGFLAGVVFEKGILRKTRASIVFFGFLSALVIYGGIMNPASVLMVTATPTKEMIYSAFLMGLPIDLVHAVSTAFFLWFLSEPFIEKIERIKVKYGILE